MPGPRQSGEREGGIPRRDRVVIDREQMRTRGCVSDELDLRESWLSGASDGAGLYRNVRHAARSEERAHGQRGRPAPPGRRMTAGVAILYGIRNGWRPQRRCESSRRGGWSGYWMV